ncbi:hemerythrin domain-containing protein [Propionivibrio limicola]|uniref:hemerythrin domain-containing protein n=1 Tax=Propionivibrio limicola TaxID=167645 RepID=UPI001290C0C4|nr:hemerythrin domain-containing protein [Propionivibrio limicola]
MPDSLLPRTPALDEPLEMLEACHDRIEAQLATLERLLAHLPDHGADEQARQAAQAILRYFGSAGPNHHEDEERNLFPTIIARARADDAEAVRSLVRDLLADHGRMASALDAVQRQLVPIAEGRSAALDTESVRQLTSLYRQHIEKENRELLAVSRRLLRADDIEALSHAMTARRSPKHR